MAKKNTNTNKNKNNGNNKKRNNNRNHKNNNFKPRKEENKILNDGICEYEEGITVTGDSRRSSPLRTAWQSGEGK